MIVVKPEGGLCNRMRVIDSCMSVKRYSLNNHTIKMIWELNPSLNCPFESLFEPIENIELVATDPCISYFLYYKNRPVRRLRELVKKALYGFKSYNYQYFDDESLQEVAYDHNYWKNNKKDLVIKSCIDFYSPTIKNPEIFVPVPTLQQSINKEIDKFINPTIGIHIRRTDSVKSIANSTTEMFLKKIEASIKMDSNQLFYLATDDTKEEALIISNFGELIITQKNKDLDRNSTKGIQDALVDLYSLSKTQQIWGSYWSSFSKTAAGLNNIPLEIIG